MYKHELVGKTVTVKKGSIVKSYNPSKPEYTTTKTQKVKIDHVIGNDASWVGTGKYWCWTNISNIIT